jgi:hypothetical protein
MIEAETTLLELLAKSPVAVEKVRFSENRLKMGDQKCIPGRRKSLIGHPSATIFQRDLRERVFQQLRLFATVITDIWLSI